ncbi:hypothetical protein [Roseovarius nitratireducens]|uniref:hypothetical protein n=1 Tax=Roseovarius nitratireducens TaxID=2044597 RepID=UPI000CE1B759|nr:hypothetical protein [Roseovarius nitratireducens]
MTENRNTEEMSNDLYLIEKRGLYYRPNAAGYTGLKSQAGRYSFEDAAERVGPNGPDGPQDGMGMWRESEAPEYSSRCPWDLRMKDHAYRQGYADGKAQGAGKITVTAEMQERFADWFRQNYPGPDTIIHKPDWHAPKIFRAALHCIPQSTLDLALSDTCRNCAGEKWVCENHRDRPWSVDGCECGAGAPCPICQWEYATAGTIGSAVWPDELRAEANRRQARNNTRARADALTSAPVTVGEAARVLLDHTPNPVFDRLKPVMMGEHYVSLPYYDAQARERFENIAVPWTVQKDIVRAAFHALAGGE